MRYRLPEDWWSESLYNTLSRASCTFRTLPTIRSALDPVRGCSCSATRARRRPIYSETGYKSCQERLSISLARIRCRSPGSGASRELDDAQAPGVDPEAEPAFRHLSQRRRHPRQETERVAIWKPLAFVGTIGLAPRRDGNSRLRLRSSFWEYQLQRAFGKVLNGRRVYPLDLGCWLSQTATTESERPCHRSFESKLFLCESSQVVANWLSITDRRQRIHSLYMAYTKQHHDGGPPSCRHN